MQIAVALWTFIAANQLITVNMTRRTCIQCNCQPTTGSESDRTLVKVGTCTHSRFGESVSPGVNVACVGALCTTHTYVKHNKYRYLSKCPLVRYVLQSCRMRRLIEWFYDRTCDTHDAYAMLLPIDLAMTFQLALL